MIIYIFFPRAEEEEKILFPRTRLRANGEEGRQEMAQWCPISLELSVFFWCSIMLMITFRKV